MHHSPHEPNFLHNLRSGLPHGRLGFPWCWLMPSPPRALVRSRVMAATLAGHMMARLQPPPAAVQAERQQAR